METFVELPPSKAAAAFETKSQLQSPPPPTPPHLHFNHEQKSEYEKMNEVNNNQKIEEETVILCHPFPVIISGTTHCEKNCLT